MKPTAAAKTNTTISIDRRVELVFANISGNPRRVQADSSGDLPKRVAVLQVGMWHTPYHGDIMITPDDMAEIVANFDAGIARAGSGTLGLPINFGHDQSGEAAGWMNGLVIEGDTLYADPVEWTQVGKDALTAGEWKCFSAEFWAAGRGGWCDPLDDDNYIENVLEGGALTNIPLFRNLEPVMASVSAGKDKPVPGIFLMDKENNKEGKQMTLEEVIAKEVDALSEDEKSFLTDHKAELNQEQLTKFGFEANADNDGDGEDENKEEEAEVPEVKEEQVVNADKNNGNVMISASALKELQDSSDAYRTEKAEQAVQAHIARGAVKADSKSKWVDQMKKDAEATEALMASIPSNPALEAQIGEEHSNEEVDVREAITNLAKSKVEASRKTDKPMSIQEAMREATQDLKDSNQE